MPRFYFRKLVRDKVVQNCHDDPQVTKVSWRELGKDDFRHELIQKIHEEADEIPLDDAKRDETLSEIADLQNVVDALRELTGLSQQDVRKRADLKTAEKGGFALRQYIEYVEVVDDSDWVALFRSQPDKYEERQ